MYLVFTRMPGASYRWPLTSLLLCLFDFLRALINRIVMWLWHCSDRYTLFYHNPTWDLTPSQLPPHRQLGVRQVQWTLQQERQLRQILPPIHSCLLAGGAGRILQAAWQAGLSANPSSPEKVESQHCLQASSCSFASHTANLVASDQNPTKRTSLTSLLTSNKHSSEDLSLLR